MADKRERKNKGYANKMNKDGAWLGVERNHTRHPACGIPWCKLCAKEDRQTTRGLQTNAS